MWRLAVVLMLIGWMLAVLLAGLVLNAFRIDEGPTVVVLDASRGWGLHRMDLMMIAIAVTPVELVCLGLVLSSLLRGDRDSTTSER